MFFEVSVGGKSAGPRIIVELFQSVCPRTVENFKALCTGLACTGLACKSGKPLHFKGSCCHRIIPGFMCQGGDFTAGDLNIHTNGHRSLDLRRISCAESAVCVGDGIGGWGVDLRKEVRG